MGKGKRFLSLFLSAAMVVTGINFGTPITVNAETDTAMPAKLAYFSFDSDVTSGENTTATATGDNAVITTDDKRVGAGALSLSNSSYLTLNTDLSGKSELTISYWSKSSSDKTGWVYFAAKSDEKPTWQAENYIGILDNTGTITVERYLGGRTNGSMSTTGTSDWKYVTVVMNESSSTLYVNGIAKVTQAEQGALTSILDSSSKLRIGKANWGEEYYTGLIDEFSVYDGALTEAQVAAEYLKNATRAERNAYCGIEDSYTDAAGNMNLPTEKNGITISWASSDASKLTDAGEVLQEDGSEVTLTATASLNEKTIFQEQYTVVLRDADQTAKETADLLKGMSADERMSYLGIYGKNGNLITTDLNLVTNVKGVAITWASNSEDKIDAAGKVKVKDGSEVTLTATGTYGNETLFTDSYTVTLADDEAVVESYDFSNGLGGASTAIQGTAAYTGATEYGTGKNGENDKAVNLAGKYGLKLNSTNLGDKWTVSVWMNPSSTIAGNGGVLFVGSNNTSSQQWVGIAGNNSTQAVKLWSVGKDSTSTNSYENKVVATTTLPANQWSMLTLSQDGDTTYLYLNGTLVKSDGTAAGMINADQSIWVGVTPWSGDAAFNGLVDNINVYDTALTSAQVAAQYLKDASSAERASYLGVDTESFEYVTGDLELPTEKNGLNIEWSSSDTAKLSNEGKVLTKDGSEVTLTAAVKCGEKTVCTETYTAKLAATVTIKFVDSEGNEIKESETVDVKLGESYTYSLTEEQKVITKDANNIYTYKEDENASLTIGSVTANDNVITLTYEKVEASVSKQTDVLNLETRVGIAPELPEKVKATYTDNTERDAGVTWESVAAENYEKAGTFTVNGVFTGTSITVSAAVTVKDKDDYLTAAYSFDEDTWTDSTSKHGNAEASGTVTTVKGLSGNAVKLPGGAMDAGAVKLPDDLLTVDSAGMDDFTISMFIKRDSNGNSYAMTLLGTDGHTAWTSSGGGPSEYLGLVNKNSVFSIDYRKDSVSTEVKSSDLTVIDEWTHIAIVTSGSTDEAWLYKNGTLVAYSDSVTINASELAQKNNFLGRSAWTDSDYAGTYDEFKVYNAVLTADEIKDICDSTLYEAQIDQTAAALEISSADESVTYDKDNVTANLVLPTTGEGFGEGTTVGWSTSNESFVTADGTVTRPSQTEGDQTITLTATITAGSYSKTKEFVVTVKATQGVSYDRLKQAITAAQAAYDEAAAKNIYKDTSIGALKSAIETAQQFVAENENVEGSTVTDEEVTQALNTLNEAASKEFVLKSFDEVNEEMLAWYPLTENADDAAANGNNGTATGVSFSRENGATFSGGSKFTSYINIPTENLNITDQMTFSFWAYDQAGTKSNAFGIGSGKKLSNGSGTGENAYHFTVLTGGGAGLNAQVGKYGWSDIDGVTGVEFSKETWHLVTCVLDGTELNVYVDGALKGSKTVAVPMTEIWENDSANRYLWIGNNVYGLNGDADYKGSIKDFRIYNAALAADQIADIYEYMGSLPMEYAKSDLIESMGATVNEGSISMDVIGDLELPSTGVQGETITWVSSDSAINAETGAVTAPEGAEPKEVTLTATIALGNDTTEVAFTCTVYNIKALIVNQTSDLSIETRVGIAPELPEKVNAACSNNMQVDAEVTWESVTAEQYETAGTFEVSGKFTGTEVTVKATVTVKAKDDYLLAKYSFDDTMSDSVNPDNTDRNATKDGTNADGIINVDGLSGKAISLPGGSRGAAAIKLPDDLLMKDGVVQDDITVSMFVNRQEITNSFAWTFCGSNTTNYFGLMNNDQANRGLCLDFQKSGVTGSHTTYGEIKTDTGKWVHIAVVLKSSEKTCEIYKNGVRVDRTEGITVKPSDLTQGNNWLGRSVWGSDSDYAASYDEFAVYGIALTAEEVKDICDSEFSASVAETKADLAITNADGTAFDAENVTTDLTLPTAGKEGTVITWTSSNTDVVMADGTVIRPSYGEGDQSVTLTATIQTGSVSDTKEFTITVKQAAGVNFTNLTNAIADAEKAYAAAEKENIYTDASMKNLSDVLAEAKAVEATKDDENSTTTTDDVKTATQKLRDAVAGLVLKNLDEINEEMAAWYPLTEDANDATVNGNNGTATGVTFSRENGATFTGSGKLKSYISLPTTMFDGKDQLTVSFWTKNTDSTANRDHAVFGFGSGTTITAGEADVYKYFLINTNNNSKLKAVLSLNSYSNEKGFNSSDNIDFAKNTWSHITCVFNGTKLTLYKDGVQVGEKDTGINLTEIGTNRVAYIGNSIYGDPDYIGSVKDFRVYNAPLAADQVKEVYDYMSELQMGYTKSDLIEAIGATVGDDGTVSLNVLDDSLTLPVTGVQGEEITWVAGSEIINVETGEVTLPDVDSSSTVTLTATIKLGETLETVVINCTVYNGKELKELLTEAETYEEGNYTAASWTQFKNALEAAKAQAAQPTDAQAIADAKAALQSAKEALVDVSELNALIAEAEKLEETDYTTASWNAFYAALTSAKETAADDNADQTAVTDAKEALETAKGALVERGDKTQLNALIAEAEMLEETDYTAASWNAFYTALTSAKETAADDNADQAATDAAKAALQSAKEALVDVSELNALIAEAEMLEETDYTTASWNAFYTALTSAKETAADDNADQTAIADAKEALETAKDELVIIAELTALLAAVADYVEGNYTETSWENFITAKTEAAAVAAKADASQTEVNEAKEALESAVKGLVNVAEFADLIDEVEALEDTKSDYTPESWDALQTALTAAKEQINNPTSDEALAMAKDNLEKAKAALVKCGDKTKLNTLIAEVEKLTGADYTTASWNELQAVLLSAKETVDNANADQAAVDAAEKALTDAKAALVDLTELKELIAEVKGLSESYYTPASWKELQTALETANTTLKDADASQTEVAAAAETLLNAELGLKDRANVAGLNALIAEAEGLEETDYTPSSWKELQSVLAEVKPVAENGDVLQAVVNESETALQTAVDGLARRADTADLDTLIAEAEGLKEADYTPTSWAALQTSLKAAKAIAEDAEASQAAVDEAKEALQTAVDELAGRADTADLNILIAEAEELKEADYTPTSWAALQTSLKAAKTIAEDAEASQAAVDEAKEALQTAVNELAGRADTADLNILIAEAEELKAADYTEESWNKLQAALETAKTTSENTDAAQEDVDAAKTALEEAINALVKAEVLPVTYTVTFAAANGTADTKVTVKAGEKVAKPADPTRNGYKFAGWFAEGADTAFDFNTAITGDITLTAKWTKVSAPVSIKSAKVTVAKATYTGKALKPKVTVSINGKTLKSGTDYTLKYSNNKKVGQGKVTITGKGNYTGTKTATFNIVPKKNKISKLTNTKGKKLVVKFSKAVGAKGYEVSYSTDKKFQKSVKKVTTTKTTVTLKKLTKNKKYYVRVRSYTKIGNKKVYSAYSAVKNIKIKK